MPGELLFDFVRASDRAPMSCELRFHGESYGWEAQFLERGELFYSRDGFVLRSQALARLDCVRHHAPPFSVNVDATRSARIRAVPARSWLSMYVRREVTVSGVRPPLV
jgi:hypothetical protein